MKRKMFLLMMLMGIFSIINVNAQSKLEAKDVAQDKKEQASFRPSDGRDMKVDAQNIIKLKREFFKKNLVLSDREMEAFWPLFDRYLDEEQMIHQQFKTKREEHGIKRVNGDINFETLNDEQIILFFDSKYEMKGKLLDIDRSFYLNIKKILSPKTVVQYYKLEKSFKNEIVKKAHQSSCKEGETRIDVKKSRR